MARAPGGEVLAEKAWGDGIQLGHDGAVAHLADFIRGAGQGMALEAVGHRVVHGGPTFSHPALLDAPLLAALEQFVPLAPLHQPHNLRPIRVLLDRRPELPQVACFDTAFHATNPELAHRFAIPGDLHDAGVRRYGFHGLSYEYIASVLPDHDSRAALGRTVVCHLGNGSSMCAIDAGRSVASTMGFTALDGLPMGTRCGAIDPGVLLYLMDERKMGARAIESLLYRESGLLGVSGLSSDMRILLESHEPRAALAVDLYVYRIGRELGSLAAALGGLDALVFTAGIGEHSAAIRERVCRSAAWLGVTLDESANRAGGPRISTTDSQVSAWVIPTNEELMIARHTQRLVASRTPAHR
jgi:acetate kinase